MNCSELPAASLPWDENAYQNDIIGSSQSFKWVLQQVQTVAPTPFTVLIQGETGTGKEVIAQAIHNGSSRRNGPFVKLNCAAIPAGLLESELFGHDRGAFTGAVCARLGRFQLADGGTLLLDEIGELPLELQPKLLRVLQDQTVEKLGSTRTIRIDVRIVAATNQNLARMVEERRFRPDLYYRLNVFPITLPPLRDRAEDIPALVEHFVQKFSDEMGRRIETIPPEVMDILKLYDWPGNIREMENIIKRAVIMSPGSALRPLFGELKRLPAQASPAAKRTLAEAERDHIVEVLRETRWVLGGDNGAAARLGMPRTTLVYRMRKLGIARDQGAKPFRSRPSGLPDSPVEFSGGRQESPLGGTEGTIEEACSMVGTA
jgi:formate hydrogenlyase transcriptional activator